MAENEDLRGSYTYETYEHGKIMSGFTKNVPASERERNNNEQRNFMKDAGVNNKGAIDVHGRAEAGHGIANRFGASGGKENLTVQNHDTNVAMRHIENGVAKLNDTDAKNIELTVDHSMDKNTTHMSVTSYGNDVNIPDNYMITITHTDENGKVDTEHISLMNYANGDEKTLDQGDNINTTQLGWEKQMEDFYANNPDLDDRPVSTYNPETGEINIDAIGFQDSLGATLGDISIANDLAGGDNNMNDLDNEYSPSDEIVSLDGEGQIEDGVEADLGNDNDLGSDIGDGIDMD